jgi:hypothetical protein
MEQDFLKGGIVPLTHDGQFNQQPRQIPDDIPVLLERAVAGGGAPSVGFENFSNFGDATAPQTIIKGTGPFMSIVNVNLVFWGQEWQSASPPVTPAAVQQAVRNICNGPYLEAAYKYANHGSASVKNVVSTNTPNAPVSPATFNKASVTTLLTSLLNAGTLPGPKSTTVGTNLYVVLPPSIAIFGPGGVNGFHAFFDWTNPATSSNERVYYAVVLNNGTLDFITTVLSHELVEAYTDPEGTFIQVAPANPNSWNEVGDVCQSSAYLDGVLVQSYWSQDLNACVIPFYEDGEIRDNVPPGLDLQVIAIRRAWSRERRSFWIQKIKVKDLSTGNTFEVFSVDAIVLIENGKNTFFVSGTGGARATVVVKQVHNHAVLSTQPDGTTSDNLLSLPAF